MKTDALSASPSSGVIDDFERGLKFAGKTVLSGVNKVKAASGGGIQALEDALGDVGEAVEETLAVVFEVPNRVWPGHEAALAAQASAESERAQEAGAAMDSKAASNKVAAAKACAM